MHTLRISKYILSALLFLLVAAPTAWAKPNKSSSMRGLRAVAPMDHAILGTGISFVIPVGALSRWLGDDMYKASYTYRVSAIGGYSLTKDGTGLEVRLSYEPTAITYTQPDITLALEEQHFTILPALAFTRTSSKSIYNKFTLSIGYEFDYVFDSKFRQDNGELDSTWEPPYDWAGSIVLTDRYEFPYSFYIEAIVSLPITHLYNLVQLKKREVVRIDEYLLTVARATTSNWFELGIGLNIIELISPSQPRG
jgi:hypothetical protein